MPCPCCGGTGACCVPPKEPCRVIAGPCAPGSFGADGCPEELGQSCEEDVLGDRFCISYGDVPVGECEGDVIGDTIPGYCVANSTQAACDALGGTFYSGQTCEQICCGPCDEENPCPEGCECVDGECVTSPCSGPCDGENPCPEGCKCCNGECIPVDQCCEYSPCECPEGRVPAPTLSGDVYGCCPPELPFDNEGFCCADPADVDTCNYDIAGPFYVCPEGCGCREGVQEDVENGMDPAFIGLSVCVPVNENPLP